MTANPEKITTFAENPIRSDARVAEEARLESVYTPKAYRGFESPSLRNQHANFQQISVFVLRIEYVRIVLVFVKKKTKNGTFWQHLESFGEGGMQIPC